MAFVKQLFFAPAFFEPVIGLASPIDAVMDRLYENLAKQIFRNMEASTENYQLKWHSFGSHLHGCVANFHNNDFFSDVTLFTMDGHQLVAHRFILSTCSQYFHQLFKHHYKLSTNLPLIIILPPEISYKTLKVLMQYMYTGETTVSKDILESVLRGGDLLKVKGLWRPREEDLHEKKLVKVHHQEVPPKSPIVLNEGVGRSEAKSPELSARNDVRVTYENKHKQQAKVNSKCGGEKLEAKEQQGKIQAVEPQKITEEKKDENSSSSDNLQYLVIKEEPLEWSEVNESDMELIEESGVFHTEMTIKPEVVIEDTAEEPTEQIYSPLTCELCAETFTIPADWVKHIQSHTDMMPAKRQRRGRSSTDEEPGTFPPLHCDMCQKFFATPAEWVHHIQNTHTEFELRLSNKSSTVRPIRINRQVGPVHKVCSICNKKFPSHASMLIHKRTHTGEKPYMCEFCYKGFNVKSNLLRHLRTLHDKIINSTDVETKEDGDAEASMTVVQHVQ